MARAEETLQSIASVPRNVSQVSWLGVTPKMPKLEPLIDLTIHAKESLTPAKTRFYRYRKYTSDKHFLWPPPPF